MRSALLGERALTVSCSMSSSSSKSTNQSRLCGCGGSKVSTGPVRLSSYVLGVIAVSRKDKCAAYEKKAYHCHRGY